MKRPQPASPGALRASAAGVVRRMLGMAGMAGLLASCSAPEPVSSEGPRPGPPADLRPLETKLAHLEERVNLVVAAQSQLSKAQQAAAATPAAVDLRPLEARVASLEAALEAALAKAAESRPAAAPEDPNDRPKRLEAAHAAVLLLVDKLLRKELSPSEKERLFALAALAGDADTVLDPLEDLSKKNPNDLGAQVELGNACLEIAKAMTGDVGFRALALRGDAALDRALRIDPNNWEAQYLKYTSYANWPTFMGKQMPAVEGLEGLARRQEVGSPDPKYVGVYTTLANLYAGLGDNLRARQTLERAITMFPENAELRAALASHRK